MQKIGAWLFSLAILAGGVVSCTPPPEPLVMQAPLSEEVAVQTPGLQNVTVQILCLEIEQYPDEYSELTMKAAQRILGELGWRVENQGQPCDATLNLTLTAEDKLLEAGPPPLNYVQHVMVDVQATFTGSEYTAITLPISQDFSFRTEFGVIEPAIDMLWDDVLLDSLTQLWSPQVLVVAIRDENDSVRDAAAEAFGNIAAQAEEFVPVLVQALETGDAHVRAPAARALGNIGPGAEEAVPTLIQALKDEDLRTRYTAAEALGNIGARTDQVVPALIQTLNDDWRVRQAAVKALGNIGPDGAEAVPALIQALADANSYDRWDVVEALRAITGQDLGDDVVAWQAWWEAQ